MICSNTLTCVLHFTSKHVNHMLDKMSKKRAAFFKAQPQEKKEGKMSENIFSTLKSKAKIKPGTHHQKHMETQNKDRAKVGNCRSPVSGERTALYKVINFYQNFHCVSKEEGRAEVVVMHLAFHIQVTAPSLKWLHGSRFCILEEC